MLVPTLWHQAASHEKGLQKVADFYEGQLDATERKLNGQDPGMGDRKFCLAHPSADRSSLKAALLTKGSAPLHNRILAAVATAVAVHWSTWEGCQMTFEPARFLARVAYFTYESNTRCFRLWVLILVVTAWPDCAK